MAAQALLLVTQGTGGRPTIERSPLNRIVLPAGAISWHEILPLGHVWWVERHKQALWLRARCRVSRASLEEDQSTGRRHLIWHLDTGRSERITWPGTGLSDVGNITRLLDGAVPAAGDGVALFPIASNLDAELENRRQQIAPDLGSLDHARLALGALFRRSALHLAGAEPRPSFDQAWGRVRAYFAREELIGVGGCDPYAVAATILAGYEEVPDPAGGGSSGAHVSPHGGVEFREFDAQHPAHQERPWRMQEPTLLDLALLERETWKHQQIVKSLAEQVRGLGFRPAYNEHVDLQVEYGDDEVLFEVKTTTPANFSAQVRRAVGQLLEYRFRYRRPAEGRRMRLVAIVEAGASQEQYEFARQFLADVGIALILWKPDTSRFEALDQFLPTITTASQ